MKVIKVIAIGILGFLVTGCVIKTTSPCKGQTPTSSNRHTKVNPTPLPEPTWKPIPMKPRLTKDEREACDVLYTTYRGCYGLGIQYNNTDMCVASGLRLGTKLYERFGDEDLGGALGAICAAACESANQQMAMPSYDDFSDKFCR